HGTGHRSILWNITSLDPNAEMRLGFIQLSIGAVSPGASLVLRGQNGGFEIPAQALTLERNWLETLRGTDVMEELPPEQQLVLWINEVYHLFVVHTLDLSSIPTDDPFWRALHAGVFIFSGKNLAFIVGKDHRYLTVCPRVVEGKVELNTKQIAAEIVRFMRDERVKQFFSCEALLGSNKI
ncbi:MAG: hypothetical protein ACXVA9_04130, partial [Bdellovibrionales bacterium]